LLFPYLESALRSDARSPAIFGKNNLMKAMRQYRLRLIGMNGEARIEKIPEQPTLTAV
jgi:hypothetical protein